jgi:hypothetical protein
MYKDGIRESDHHIDVGQTVTVWVEPSADLKDQRGLWIIKLVVKEEEVEEPPGHDVFVIRRSLLNCPDA